MTCCLLTKSPSGMRRLAVATGLPPFDDPRTQPGPSPLHQVLIAALAGLHGVVRLTLMALRTGGAVALSRPGRIVLVLLLVVLLLRRVRTRIQSRIARRRSTRG